MSDFIFAKLICMAQHWCIVDEKYVNNLAVDLECKSHKLKPVFLAAFLEKRDRKKEKFDTMEMTIELKSD